MSSTLVDIQKRLKCQPETDYPDSVFMAGPEAPCRFEAEIYNCTVRGEIPPQIDGTYYRCMPDLPFAPLYEDDVFINGDGCIDAVRIENGHADFKQRFVRTEKFLIERVARQSVFGKYRNRYTDDPRVKHKVHSTANTHIIHFENQLLALKEDSLPYALDRDTLETKGIYDFHGQYSGKTHTSHPKIDPLTGELITMGYEAKGDATTDVVYHLFDKNGKMLEECWINAPYVGMMHDMAATDKWVVFILLPLAGVPVEMLEEGHKHFAYDESKDLMFGILPRRNPKPEDLKWFHYKNAFTGHTGNAFDGEDGCIYMDATLFHFNQFWFFPPIGEEMGSAKSSKPTPGNPISNYVRWRFDPNATDGRVEPTVLVNVGGEMPKVDDRFVTKPYNTVFLSTPAPKSGEGAAPLGVFFNTFAKCNVKTGKIESWCAGENTEVQEVAFVARSPDAPEADGYIVSIVNQHDLKSSCILILDSAKMAEGPIAIIELPFRLRNAIHGSWVPGHVFQEKKDLCDMHGVTDELRKEFSNIKVVLPQMVKKTNGVHH